MRFHYVWLIWSSAFLLPWLVLYLANRRRRSMMWRVSLITSVFGLTEPLFVPSYWLPPSLFDLAQRTRFDIESLIFSFAIGGIGAVFYDALTGRSLAPHPRETRRAHLHRFHRAALLVPVVTFIPLALLPWNTIYAAVSALLLGSVASAICRPNLVRKMWIGGALFLSLYAVFVFGLSWLAPGYIAAVWNLPALSGLFVADVPVEEFLFGASFGLYWSSVYEHLTWTRGVRERAPNAQKLPSPPSGKFRPS